MILQTRDQYLLSSLSRYGILSSAQITELHFKKIRHTTMMRRLRQLEKENFIMRAKGMPDSMSAWYLGAKGAKAIGAENIVLHEVTLSSVRLVLESLGLGHDFTTETEIRRQYTWNRNDPENAKRVIPDGLFVTEKFGKSHVVALEVELQPKNHFRLNRIFTEYATMSSITWVLYVAGNLSIANLILSEWNKVRRYDYSPNLYIALLDELKSDSSKARLFDYLGIVNPISTVFEIKKPLLSLERNDSRKTAHGVSGNAEECLSRQAS
jgi:hypothetical protein